MKQEIMKRIAAVFLCLSLLCGCSAPAAGSPAGDTGVTAGSPNNASGLREFTDSLGRTVLLPEKIEKLALSGPLAQIYIFPLCPELLAGVSNAFSPDAIKYIPQQYQSLPELGQLYGGKGTLNLEALLAAAPDLVVDMGEPKDGMPEDLDKLSSQTGIPFVHIDATVETSADSYRTLGKLIGNEARAEELACWCEKTLNSVRGIMEKVDAADARKNVICCFGAKGLNVLPDGSFHARVISLVANNAAVPDSPLPNGDGNEIDMEQLMLWDPDVIIFQHGSIYNEVSGSSSWSRLRTIRDGNYCEVPFGPYGWISSPPAVQCYLGMLWLAAVLYPDYIDYDLQTEITEYYQLFYDYDLSDDDWRLLTVTGTLSST